MRSRYVNLAFSSNRILSAFGSTATLESQLTCNIASMLSTDEVFLGCSTYREGERAAIAYSDRAEITLYPFYVSLSEDVMCFTVESSTTLDATQFPYLHSLFTIPPPLKVDPTVLSLLDVLDGGDRDTTLSQDVASLLNGDMASSTNALELRVSLLAPRFPKQARFSNPMYASSIVESIAQQLIRYDLQVMGAMYCDTPTEQSPSVVEDAVIDTTMLAERSPTVRFANYRGKIARGGDVEGLAMSDPCGYADIKFSASESTVTFPLHSSLAASASLRAACLGNLIAHLSSHRLVDTIALGYSPQLLNVRCRSIIQSGAVGTSSQTNPYASSGLLGTGTVIGIADSGLDENSCYFNDAGGRVTRSLVSAPIIDLNRRKVVQYSRLAETDAYDTINGHGSHVAGTAAGNNQQSLGGAGQLSGVAPNAKIAFLDIGTASGTLYGPSPTEEYTCLRASGALIVTNSWGSTFSGAGYYTGTDVDQYLYTHPDTLILFACGNSGTNGAGSVTMEASAKSVVAVGASETTLGSTSITNVGWFSSQGPTYDNRIKPDIVSPGMSVESVLSENPASSSLACGTTTKAGTSMASPSAAGSAALMRQYFIDPLFWATQCEPTDPFCRPFTPSGVLLKTMLLHSGAKMNQYFYGQGSSKNVPLTAGTPDFYQGFGRIQLSNALPLAGSYRFLLFIRDLLAIPANSQRMKSISVDSSARPLKLTLTWYDPPGSSSSSKALINDLDLTLFSPSNQIYYANRGTGFDRVNTNEQIIIPVPTVGVWRVYVTSNALPVGGSQLFSLVFSCIGRTIFASSQDVVEGEGVMEM